MKRLLLLVFPAAVAFCQNPAINGAMRAVDLTRRVREIEALEEQTRLLREQTELIRQHREELRRGSQTTKPPAKPLCEGGWCYDVSAPKATPPAQDELSAIAVALTSMRSRYPDFDKFHEEIVRLAPMFQIGKAPLEVWLEMLYVVAKHASFSQSPNAAWRTNSKGSEADRTAAELQRLLSPPKAAAESTAK